MLVPIRRENMVFQERVEVEMQKNWCKAFDSIFAAQIGIQRQNPSLSNWQSFTKCLVKQSQLSIIVFPGKCVVVVDGSFFPEHLEYV